MTGQPFRLPAQNRPMSLQDRPITREQLLISAGVTAGIAVAALDSTVVGTAMPTTSPLPAGATPGPMRAQTAGGAGETPPTMGEP